MREVIQQLLMSQGILFDLALAKLASLAHQTVKYFLTLLRQE
jgi:hypothetical protein